MASQAKGLWSFARVILTFQRTCNILFHGWPYRLLDLDITPPVSELFSWKICPDSAPGTETGAQALWGDFYPAPLTHATSCLSEVMLSEYPWKTKYKSILRFIIWKQHVLACSAVLIYPENKTFSIPNTPLEKQNKKYWITKSLTESEKWSSSCPRSGPKL